MTGHTNTPRSTGRVLVFDGSKLLLLKRRRFVWTKLKWLEYYSIPGGGSYPDESPDTTTRRELKEELGVTVEIERKVAVGRSKHFEHHLFFGRLVKDELAPALQANSEEMLRASKFNSYEVVWIDVANLNERNLFVYAPFLPIVQQVAGGYLPGEPVQVQLQ